MFSDIALFLYELCQVMPSKTRRPLAAWRLKSFLKAGQWPSIAGWIKDDKKLNNYCYMLNHIHYKIYKINNFLLKLKHFTNILDGVLAGPTGRVGDIDIEVKSVQLFRLYPALKRPKKRTELIFFF